MCSCHIRIWSLTSSKQHNKEIFSQQKNCLLKCQQKEIPRDDNCTVYNPLLNNFNSLYKGIRIFNTEHFFLHDKRKMQTLHNYQKIHTCLNARHGTRIMMAVICGSRKKIMNICCASNWTRRFSYF